MYVYKYFERIRRTHTYLVQKNFNTRLHSTALEIPKESSLFSPLLSVSCLNLFVLAYVSFKVLSSNPEINTEIKRFDLFLLLYVLLHVKDVSLFFYFFSFSTMFALYAKHFSDF